MLFHLALPVALCVLLRFPSIDDVYLQCAVEGLSLAFQTQPQLAANPGQKNEVYAQVNVSH